MGGREPQERLLAQGRGGAQIPDAWLFIRSIRSSSPRPRSPSTGPWLMPLDPRAPSHSPIYIYTIATGLPLFSLWLLAVSLAGPARFDPKFLHLSFSQCPTTRPYQLVTVWQRRKYRVCRKVESSFKVRPTLDS